MSGTHINGWTPNVVLDVLWRSGERLAAHRQKLLFSAKQAPTVIGVVSVHGLVPSTIPLGVWWGVSTSKNPQRISGLDQTLVSGTHITGWDQKVVLGVLWRSLGCRGGFDTDFQPKSGYATTSAN